ncbi:MAG: hypothetical protein IJH93_03735 [Lachnospiraceae bacterium]|nr:hypothetical protein [Sarcina sp.]MBQ6590641.1 hypothetical protein [Lachnospiraceae bacterium]
MKEDRKISREELFPFVHYEYGEAYYGSCGNMRYRLAREPLENVHFTPPDKRGEASLRAVVWKGPMGYAATEESLKTQKLFPFSEEGMEQAADWLNEQANRTWR